MHEPEIELRIVMEKLNIVAGQWCRGVAVFAGFKAH
jgi:hypothetical protein